MLHRGGGKDGGGANRKARQKQQRGKGGKAGGGGGGRRGGQDAPLHPPPPNTRAKHTRPHLSAFAFCSLSTFFTIFCSSTRNARTMRSRTTECARWPPYARRTVLARLGATPRAFSLGRVAGIWGEGGGRGGGQLGVDPGGPLIGPRFLSRLPPLLSSTNSPPAAPRRTRRTWARTASCAGTGRRGGRLIERGGGGGIVSAGARF